MTDDDLTDDLTDEQRTAKAEVRDAVQRATARAVNLLIEAGLAAGVDVAIDHDADNGRHTSALTVYGARVWALHIDRALDGGTIVSCEWLVDDLRTLAPRAKEAC